MPLKTLSKKFDKKKLQFINKNLIYFLKSANIPCAKHRLKKSPTIWVCSDLTLSCSDKVYIYIY